MRVPAVVALAVVSTAAVTARADRATSDRLAAEAGALAQAANFAGAAAKYREAFAADPRAELVCNTGVAFYKLPDLPRAERYLQECLAAGSGELDAAFLARVRAVVANVESSLAAENVTPVELSVEPSGATVVVDAWPDEPVAAAQRIWLAYGRHHLVIRAPGYVDQTIELDATSHETAKRAVILVHIDVPGPGPRAPVGPSKPSAPSPGAAPSRRASSLLLIGGGALAAVGVGFHALALGQRSELDDAREHNRPDDWDAHDGRFRAERAIAITSYGLAAVAGVAGLVLYLRHPHDRERAPSVSAILAPGVAGVTVEWTR